MVNIGNEWDSLLKTTFESENYLTLRQFLKTEYRNYTIYPPATDIFNALKMTDFGDVRAVILGQDPYHGEGQAHGMCFSVQKGIEPPPSLKNIYKEIKDDIGIDMPMDYGCLENWAKQGVLLLNTVLTVRSGAAASHRGRGWEQVTDKIISLIGEREQPTVFLLWGRPAREKKRLITGKNHLVLECAHPSPLSAYNGFFGCRHFSRANAFLKENGLLEIDWRVL